MAQVGGWVARAVAHMIFSTSAWVKGAVCSSWRDTAARSAAAGTVRSSRLERAAASAREEDDARMLRPAIAVLMKLSPCTFSWDREFPHNSPHVHVSSLTRVVYREKSQRQASASGGQVRSYLTG